MPTGVLIALLVLVVLMVVSWMYRKKLEADLAALYSSQQTSTTAGPTTQKPASPAPTPTPAPASTPPPVTTSVPATVAQQPTGNINPHMVGPWVMQMHNGGRPVGPPRDMCMAHDGSLADTTGQSLGLMTATGGGISLVLHGQPWPGHSDGEYLVFPLANGMVSTFTKTGATHAC